MSALACSRRFEIMVYARRIVLTATRLVLIPLLMIPALSGAVSAQSSSQAPTPVPPIPANADPSFDVATIKPSDTSASHGTGIRTSGRHIAAYNFSVGELSPIPTAFTRSRSSAGRHLSLARISISRVCPTS